MATVKNYRVRLRFHAADMPNMTVRYAYVGNGFTLTLVESEATVYDGTNSENSKYNAQAAGETWRRTLGLEDRCKVELIEGHRVI